MPKWHIIIMTLILLPAQIVWGIDKNIKNKYPTVLLTEDYGILSENDLASYTWGIKHARFSIEQRAHYQYWQCFPRDQVSLSLKDKGHSSEDIEGQENLGDLQIEVSLDDHVSHQYFMRKLSAISNYEEVFHRWQKLMKNQSYVCLGGRFGGYEEKTEKGQRQKIYSWTFERIKTKKGCDSYFQNECYRTREQFIHDHNRIKKA
jgi:hypothetical protein